MSVRRHGTALLVAVVLLAAATPAFAEAGMMRLMNNWEAMLHRGDYGTLALALDSFAGIPLDKEFPGWTAIARRGAAAAKKKDGRAVREACDACHTQYKTAWREKFHR